MKWFRVRKNQSPISVGEDARAIEAAWRIHQAQVDWTGRVDAKAGLAFTIESAAIATTVALTANGRIFSNLDEWWLAALYFVGLTLLLVSAGLAALVVVPRLRASQVAAEACNNFIYFGHARLWQPGDLEVALEQRPLLPQISRQIVVMAKIAWTKHLRVQWSFSIAVIGCILLVACALARAS